MDYMGHFCTSYSLMQPDHFSSLMAGRKGSGERSTAILLRKFPNFGNLQKRLANWH